MKKTKPYKVKWFIKALARIAGFALIFEYLCRLDSGEAVIKTPCNIHQ